MISKKKFHRSLFVCCAEAYYYIMNIQIKSFEEILLESGCEILQTFKNIDTLVSFDSSMPLALKKFYMQLEIDLISRIAWKDDSTIMLCNTTLENGKENVKQSSSRPGEPQPVDQFYNRVLIYTATQMYHLCSGLPSIKEDLVEYIWAVLKYILTQKLDLLRQRHIDQMIFCTIYCVSKIFKAQLKFQDIINK